MRHTIEHVFDTSAGHLWEVFFFDEAFARGLYERMRLRVAHRELQREGAGDTLIVRRKLQIVPTRALPAALRLVFGEAPTIRETGEFSAALRRYSIKFDLPVISSRVDYGGEYTWETLPSGQVQRVWKGRCEARLPLVGATIEAFLLGETEQALGESYAYTRQYLRERAGEAAADHTAAKA